LQIKYFPKTIFIQEDPNRSNSKNQTIANQSNQKEANNDYYTVIQIPLEHYKNYLVAAGSNQLTTPK
jgi:hypothetical protein